MKQLFASFQHKILAAKGIVSRKSQVLRLYSLPINANRIVTDELSSHLIGLGEVSGNQYLDDAFSALLHCGARQAI